MDIEADHADDSDCVQNAHRGENIDFSFLPKNLTSQCQALIESFHDLHGYSCLPDILWKARLGPFIETHGELRQLLRKASTTRSAKRSSAGFVRIATTILSLEILASRFAGWSSIYPREAEQSREILRAGPQAPLIEFYLYPPKYLNSAAIAALAPPQNACSVESYAIAAEGAGHDETMGGYLDAM